MNPKITGITSFYLTALADANHSMNGLVKMLSALDPKFVGSNFEYQPQDKDLFLSMVGVQSALAINSTEGILSFTGYPLWISATDASAQVPSFFPSSIKYANEDDEVGSQKTFEEWVSDQNHDLYTIDGVTFAGDFAKHGLSFAAQVYADAGYSLLDDSDARTKIASQG
jgi:hypothetical protein